MPQNFAYLTWKIQQSYPSQATALRAILSWLVFYVPARNGRALVPLFCLKKLEATKYNDLTVLEYDVELETYAVDVCGFGVARKVC